MYGKLDKNGVLWYLHESDFDLFNNENKKEGFKMASTTDGSLCMYDLLVLEAERLGVLKSSTNADEGGVIRYSAVFEKGNKRIEMHGFRISEDVGFSLECVETDSSICMIESPIRSSHGGMTNWYFERKSEFSQSDWLCLACSASAMGSFYNGAQPHLHQHISKDERADPRSKFMECFFMDLLKELAR